MIGLDEALLARVTGRAVAAVAARALALVGHRRSMAGLVALTRALARPDRRTPMFRLSSDLAAAGIAPARLERALALLGRYPARRRVALLSSLVGIGAASLLRTRAVMERHRAAPQSSPPPIREIILATTVRCNLRCVGCYTESERSGKEPSVAVVDAVLEQAKRLGASRVHLVGKGEPFMNDNAASRALAIMRRHPDLFFTVFTNGVAVTPRTWAALAELSNVMVVVSINGLREANDRIRGDGVFDAVMRAFMRASAYGVPHGFSATVTAHNFEEVTSPEFVSLMEDAGNLFGVYFKFAVLDPAAPDGLALDARRAAAYEARLREVAERSQILLADPDVLERGIGCRARTGALLYVDLVTGRVSPCVKTPFSAPDCNVLDSLHDDRLAEVLCSPFFRRYRDGFRRGVTCTSHGTAEHEWFLRDPALDASARVRLARDASARGKRISLPVL